MLQTTQRGWQVVGVEPWADDDWVVELPDQPERELSAYVGPGGELTVIGLDTHGSLLNTAAAEVPTYSIAGLPPHVTFHLAVWNGTGTGENAVDGDVTTDALGVARFAVPVQAAFALTTVPMA